MKAYLYPQNLKAMAQLWLWSLKDFTLLTIGALLAALILTHIGWVAPMAAVLVFAFLTIRLEETTVLDFLRNAVRYFLTTQQYFVWRCPTFETKDA